MRRILVVGAGLAGCSSARLLADQGEKVSLIEARHHIAGNCYDEKTDCGVSKHVYGPHIFHTKEKRVWDFVQRFSSFNHFQHRVLSYTQGQLLPFPINRDTLCQIYGIELSTRDVKAFLAEEVASSQFHDPPENFRDAIVAQVGEYLYHCFFENYTAKQWQRDPAELSADLAGRIPVRENRDDRYFSDPYQGLPVNGYTALCESMLDHPNISLSLNTPYEAGMEKDFDFLVYTGPLDSFFHYDEGHLNFRSVRFEFETVDEEWYQKAAVVNYPNDYDFTRITEFKHMTLEKSQKTLICREYPSADGVPCYVLPDAQNQALRAKYMEKVQELEKSGQCCFIGRLAEYRYYNMDQVISRAMDRFSH